MILDLNVNLQVQRTLKGGNAGKIVYNKNNFGLVVLVREVDTINDSLILQFAVVRKSDNAVLDNVGQKIRIDPIGRRSGTILNQAAVDAWQASLDAVKADIQAKKLEIQSAAIEDKPALQDELAALRDQRNSLLQNKVEPDYELIDQHNTVVGVSIVNNEITDVDWVKTLPLLGQTVGDFIV